MPTLEPNKSSGKKRMNMTLTISYIKDTNHALNHSNVDCNTSKEEKFNNTTDGVNLIKEEFPITPAKALRLYSDQLTEYEKGEILDYSMIYYLGNGSKKIGGTYGKSHSHNHGYDDERGDYIIVLHDHIMYRYEVLGFLGKGSFGQVK